jgi:hypothetical protein
LIPLVVVRSDPWCFVFQVSGEDGLGSIDHEERREACCSAQGHPQILDDRGEFRDPSAAKFVRLKILGLRPYKIMPLAHSTCPFIRGCATTAQST